MHHQMTSLAPHLAHEKLPWATAWLSQQQTFDVPVLLLKILSALPESTYDLVIDL